MWFTTLFQALTCKRRRPTCRRGTAAQLSVEQLEGRCLPSFTVAGDYLAGDRPFDVVAADFNEDGRADLAVAADLGDSIDVRLANVDGTFGPSQSYAVGAGFLKPIAIAAGDFNGDGHLDLVVALGYDYLEPGGGGLSVLRGDGHGSFQLYQSSWMPQLFGNEFQCMPRGLAVADFNDDGRLDLVVVGRTDETTADGSGNFGGFIEVLLNDGNGWFTISFADRSTDFHANGIVAEDMNADGNMDLVVASSHIPIFYGFGDGTFSPPQAVASYFSASAVSVADFNADGNPDLATLYDKRISIWLNNGTGTFQSGQTLDLPPYGHFVMATGDFDGDGNSDVVTAEGGSAFPGTVPTATVRLSNGNGTFQPPISIPAGPSVGFPTGIAAGDFNGDGRDDVAVGSTSNSGNNSNLRVLLNDGLWTSVSVGDVTVSEGHTGTRTATFKVTLAAASSETVTIAYATADGTATAGSDYQAVSDTLTFAPGETSKTVSVTVNGDRLAEPNETFFFNLSSPTNAVLADGQGAGKILDDEPRISISDVAKKEGRKNTTLFVFTVTLSKTYDQTVTVSYRTVDGTATTTDNDYVAKTGTLTFAPGETTKTITIEVNGDSKKEAHEKFYVDLFGKSSNSLFAKKRGIATILNDD